MTPRNKTRGFLSSLESDLETIESVPTRGTRGFPNTLDRPSPRNPVSTHSVENPHVIGRFTKHAAELSTTDLKHTLENLKKWNARRKRDEAALDFEKLRESHVGVCKKREKNRKSTFAGSRAASRLLWPSTERAPPSVSNTRPRLGSPQNTRSETLGRARFQQPAPYVDTLSARATSRKARPRSTAPIATHRHLSRLSRRTHARARPSSASHSVRPRLRCSPPTRAASRTRIWVVPK